MQTAANGLARMRRGMILVSEIGDKTFFIAAIMAMKNRRATVCTRWLALALPVSAFEPKHVMDDAAPHCIMTLHCFVRRSLQAQSQPWQS
jgi:putative Ca2+/H+ antiporter (TMEM165/GDT1 family)